MKVRMLFAALLGGALSASPAAAEPPAVFITHLYAQYKDMDHWAKNFDPCAEYCEADLGTLIKAARRKNMIGYDPICQCQHGGEKYMMFMGATGVNDSEYRATMVKMGGPPGQWTLILHWVDGGWKVHDVMEKIAGKQVSLRQRLAAAAS